MACSRPEKRIANAATDHDIITILPGEIKEKILAKLPIKEAVRTSILSTKWRYTWASIPEIVMKDDDLVSSLSTIDGAGASSRFTKIVDLLLFIHKGPIIEFNLSTKHLCPEAFDRWILNLARNGITKLIFQLNFASDTKYKMPTNFFCCTTLQHVQLFRCVIKLSRGFNGFKLLSSLSLRECSISAADTEKLITGSPQLKNLYLYNLQVERSLKIYAVELKCLIIVGEILDLQMITPQLTVACIKLINFMPSLARVGCRNDLCRSFGGLLGIQRIFLYGFCIPHLVDGPVELPKAFFHLKEIILQVRISENTNSSSFWEKDIVFKHLQMVEILRFEASGPVLAFVKFILRSAPVLREITPFEKYIKSKEQNPSVFKQLLKFQRASAKAEVIFA